MKGTPASGSRGPSLRWLMSMSAGALRLTFHLSIYLYRLNLAWLLEPTRGSCSSTGA